MDTFTSGGKNYAFVSLEGFSKQIGVSIEQLPVSLRIILESVLRHSPTSPEAEAIARWNPTQPQGEVPFTVSRVILQDFTGVPLLVDLAAMRSEAKRRGKDPSKIEPLVPVDLVIDHSVQVDVAGVPQAFTLNLQKEFERNRERYQFLKWGQRALGAFNIIPPGIGIVHQVNLEHLASVVHVREQDNQPPLVFPDTLVGTDSHTTMINGLGVAGWGVGGIEAEAAMLGQPMVFPAPEVIGVYMTGKLKPGTTATDLALVVTELLRKENVVGKFVEYYGPGAESLSLADRATLANMAPEYGATMGYFPVDEETLRYLRMTGRKEAHIQLVKDYFQTQGLFGIPKEKDAIAYTRVLELDLGFVNSSLAGPKRPQDRIELPKMKETFNRLLAAPVNEGGYGVAEARTNETITHGSVLIAAITSCTNTSNPAVMVCAGLLARNAVARGLSVPGYVKTSLAPGSRVVTDYLAPFQPALDQLGFQLVGYGCTTCIGNSGPLRPEIEQAIQQNQLIGSAVLSGNRNFEARIHPSIKANFLASPPLVVAFALAGRVNIDMETEPLGTDNNGQPVFLRDIWPAPEEIQNAIAETLTPELFRKRYNDFQNPEWDAIPAPGGTLYQWDEQSTYIQEPPFFENGQGLQPCINARALAIFGDSVTTDHISPAGKIPQESPARQYLQEHGVEPKDFNSYGARRGNDRVMTRGTFANVRIRNLMLPGIEGGFTKIPSSLAPNETPVPIFDAAMAYRDENVPLIVIAGKEYGTGSSRDWAAKGTRLLGVRAVIAESFERIHRSNLAGMGVLPCCFEPGVNAETLRLDGTETYTLEGIETDLTPKKKLTLKIQRANGNMTETAVTLRLDTPQEIEVARKGGILPYMQDSVLI